MNMDALDKTTRERDEALADVTALIARVRELEERLEQRTRERDHERAIVANGCFTYSEGEVALRAQAAEAQQLAAQMRDERDDARTQLSMTQAWHEQMCRSSEKGWAEVEMLRERVTEHQRKFEAGWSVLRKQRDEARAEVATAYRRGAEAMREACARVADAHCVPGTRDVIRALPIPEEP
jgi:hypothetical protein